MYEVILPQDVFAFLLIFVRVGGAVMLLPGFSEVFIPTRVRLVLALGMAMILYQTVPPVAPPDTAILLMAMLGRELLIGLLLGLMARMILSALDIAGMIIASQSGVANAMMLNPTLTQQGGILSVFLTTTGVMVLLTSNLHHLPMMAFAQSYEVMPIDAPFIAGDMAQYVAHLMQYSFSLGVQLAAPLLVVGFIFHVGLGVLARLLPQIQVYFVAISAQTAVGFLIFWLVLGGIMTVFMGAYENVFEDWWNF